MKTKFNDIIKSIFNKEEMKKRLPYALLAGFTVSFMFFLFGVLEIFAGNRDEFLFFVTDFILYLVILALISSIIISALIMFLPRSVSVVIFGIVTWIAFMSYVQVLFLNGGNSLGGDTGQSQNVALMIADVIIWAVTGIFIISGAMLMSGKKVLKKIYLIGLIALLVMQTAGCASRIGDITRAKKDDAADDTASEVHTFDETDDVTSDATEAETDTAAPEYRYDPDDLTVLDKKGAYLTTKGLDKISDGKNIVIFIIDRFDVSYYNDLIKKEPGFFDRLDGFTYFSDNISLYSRTWPAVPTMITGIDNDFSTGANAYFTKAYTESPFLNDLKANNYKVKIYTQKYYCYRDGTPLVDLADNISVASGYTISNTAALIKNLLKLSAYRYAPNAIKDSINISSASFSGIVELNGASPLFEINDPETCAKILENGLSYDSSGNSYTFIHFNGCHSPYNMDAEANRLETEIKDSSGAIDQLRGCFKAIYYYLDEMKRLGVYDDATVVITGDHPRARDDKKEPEQPRLTALFVKPSGSYGKPLSYSQAQVSQDNLIPTLVKSAGIQTENDYGRSYFEVPEGIDTVRYHKFELSDGVTPKIVTFKVTGKGSDFSNWTIDSYKEIAGSFYK